MPNPGDVIRYKYRGEWEYAVWINNNERQTIVDPTGDIDGGLEVIEGVWKKDKTNPFPTWNFEERRRVIV
jgi:hypothetical protein